MIENKIKEFKELEKVFHRYLALETEPDYLKVVFATILANRMDSLPIWLMIIGTSSSGKSEILGALNESLETHTESLLTKNSFISGITHERVENGKVVEKEPSLLPLLDGKVLIIRDISTIIGGRTEDVKELFSQLRAAYDGKLEKATGLGQKMFKSKFGMLVGATPIVEQFRQTEQILGERFLYFRPNIYEEDNIWEKVMERGSQRKVMEKELSDVSLEFLKTVKVNPEIKKLTDFIEIATPVATLRSSVVRDIYSKEVVQPVTVGEVPIRLFMQLTTLYTGLRYVTTKSDAIAIVKRIGRDSIPLIRYKILKGIMSGVETCTDLSKDVAVSRQYMTRCLQELEMLKVIDKYLTPIANTTNDFEGNILKIRDEFKKIFYVTPYLKYE